MLLSLLVLVPSGSQADILNLELDEKAPAPQENCYTDWTYEDPSISVRIETGRVCGMDYQGQYCADYWVAYVKIANASQLRTAPALSFYFDDDLDIAEIADDENAVLAINGDWYCDTIRLDKRYVVRQGVSYYINTLVFDIDTNRYLDALTIDEYGDFRIEQKATVDRLRNLPYTVINGFAFGPALVIDGVRQENLWDMSGNNTVRAGRTCIAQTGPLEYMCICTSKRDDPNSTGLTIEAFADLVSSFEEIKTAYNLDGGSSTQMYFHNTKITSTPRKITDIIYFVSAYVPD